MAISEKTVSACNKIANDIFPTTSTDRVHFKAGFFEGVNYTSEQSKEVIEELVKALEIADAFIENLDYTKEGLKTLETIRKALTKIRNNEKQG